MSQDRVKLQIEDLHLRFGGVEALRGVSLEVKEGEILALIGPNGAGKTCVLNCINGFYHPSKGQMYCDGRRITPLSPPARADLGIARTFQAIQLYGGLSVLDNIMAGRHRFFRSGMVGCSLYYGLAHREEIRQREVVEDIIDFLEIEPWRKHEVGSLPYGLRKRVDLGRALAMEPKILLLDEPMAGMSREEKEDIARFILDIYEERGINTMVLVEHDMSAVMDLAHRVVVLDFGAKIAEGTPQEIRVDPAVAKAYLGKAE